MTGPTAVWALDHTASSTLSIAKGVMHAATTDNVQPIALIACEKFGATLAMCPETREKIEDLIKKTSGTKLVEFISATIGYSTNDCATQLSQSLAGVQFLGLAAALVSSVSMFEGANALSVLVMASASDKALVPTVRQLKDLLRALEPRFNRSGFTNIWVGYQILLNGTLGDFYGQTHLPTGRSHEDLMELMKYPATEGISKLVEAFRELARLGDVIAITIHATSCAPWVMAFTRWCLGTPPSTYSPDGKALLDQVDSRVTLFTSNDTKSSGFKIRIERSVGSPADLVINQSSSRSPFGMISLECFGRMWCQNMGGERSDTYRAMSEALPYALKQVYGLLRLFGSSLGIEHLEDATTSHLEQRARLASKYPVELGAQPFPMESTISNILTRVLNLGSQQNLMSLSEGHLISDLSSLRVRLRRLAKTCTCDLCRQMCEKPSMGNTRYCQRNDLLRIIGFYAADILALSLFENPDTLLVCLDRGDYIGRSAYMGHSAYVGVSAYAEAVVSIITSGKSTVCGTRSIIDWALGLVGHESTSHGVHDEDWIISCSKGQVVFPKVFETQNICQPGYLVLYWAPGLLNCNGENYDRGIGPGICFLTQGEDADEAPQSLSVVGPLKSEPGMKMKWKVVCCEGYLEIELVCAPVFRNAFNILVKLETSLILRGCPHDSASLLERPDRFATYMTPLYPHSRRTLLPEMYMSSEANGEHNVDVVAVDGNAGLRMIAMSSKAHGTSKTANFVIRDNSCLQCCLNLCRSAGCSVVVC